MRLFHPYNAALSGLENKLLKKKLYLIEVYFIFTRLLSDPPPSLLPDSVCLACTTTLILEGV